MSSPAPSSRISRRKAIVLVAVGWALFNALLYVALRPTERPVDGVSPETLRTFAGGRLDPTEGGESPTASLRYRLMTPPDVRPGRKYPLVVFLHGSGQRGRDNQAQLRGLPGRMADAKLRERFPCFLVAPQCPAGSDWVRRADTLEALIESLLKAQPIDRRRIYLTGFSMGGFGTWELAVRRPELFAAVAPICGGGDSGRASKLVGVPVWAVHGDADDVVPVEQSRRMIEAIRAAGGSPRYSELPGVGHNGSTFAYFNPGEVVPWLFRQRNDRSAEPIAE